MLIFAWFSLTFCVWLCHPFTFHGGRSLSLSLSHGNLSSSISSPLLLFIASLLSLSLSSQLLAYPLKILSPLCFEPLSVSFSVWLCSDIVCLFFMCCLCLYICVDLPFLSQQFLEMSLPPSLSMCFLSLSHTHTHTHSLSLSLPPSLHFAHALFILS